MDNGLRLAILIVQMKVHSRQLVNGSPAKAAYQNVPSARVCTALTRSLLAGGFG